MIRTRNCSIQCISVVCVFVCVFERVAITLFYFSAVPTKLLIRYIFIIFILVVTCNSHILSVIYPGLKIVIYKHSIKHSFIFMLSMYYSISIIFLAIFLTILSKFYCSFILYTNFISQSSHYPSNCSLI